VGGTYCHNADVGITCAADVTTAQQFKNASYLTPVTHASHTRDVTLFSSHLNPIFDLAQVDPKLVMDLLPSIAILDTTWVNKVVPALTFIPADYLVSVVKAIAPYLEKINPDQLVALIPAISKISVSTWEKLIELLNKLTTAQVGLAHRPYLV
jgi:hypothetical protein